ncbi:MAG: hypothetical protein ABIW82_08290 [Dokdonella sp.]
MQFDNAARWTGAWGRSAALAGLMVFAVTARAQNTIQNPNFATTLPPWALFLSAAPDPAGNGSAVWTAAQDASGVLGTSGAAQVDLGASPSTAHAAAGISQCVVFAAPTMVLQANYGARFKIPASDAADGSVGAAIEIRFFTDAACTQFIAGAGGIQGRTIVSGVPDDGFWYSAGDPAFTPPANTLAASAEVRASLRKLGSSATPYTTYFDNIFLSLNGTVPVSLQSFGID